MTLVKICGIRSIEEAEAVVAAGANALGFHIALNHSRCPIDIESAAKIIQRVPSRVATVIVTTLDNANAIIDTADRTGASRVILELRKRRPKLKIWRAVHVMDNDAVANAKKYESLVDCVLLDSMDKKTGARGGTGKTHDWNVSRKVVESTRVPVILAGGLTTENVADAIRTVQPYMVDVESGVSNPDGTKNLEKVKLFVEVAKASGV